MTNVKAEGLRAFDLIDAEFIFVMPNSGDQNTPWAVFMNYYGDRYSQVIPDGKGKNNYDFKFIGEQFTRSELASKLKKIYSGAYVRTYKTKNATVMKLLDKVQNY